MLPTQQYTESRETARTTSILDRLDLELQKAGNEWIDPAVRDRIARAAEVLGLDRTAGRIRETNHRRDGWPRPDLRAVPDDGRRRLRSSNDRPLLRVLDEPAAAAEPDPRTQAYEHAFDGLDRAAREPGLTPGERAGFTRLRALAAEGAGRRSAEPAEPR